MTEAYQDRWLSLGQASALLNVHSSTLRRWADGGLVPHQRTPGGHRRFSRQALLPLIEGTGNPPALGQEELDLDLAWAPRWGDSGQTAVLRESWQRLGGVTAQFLVRADDDERLVTDAGLIGSEIAGRTQAAGGNIVHAVTDYLHFRASLLPIALTSPVAEGHGATYDVPRFDRLMGEALLAIVEGFPATSDS